MTFGVNESKQGVTKVVSLGRKGENLLSVSIFFKFASALGKLVIVLETNYYRN